LKRSFAAILALTSALALATDTLTILRWDNLVTIDRDGNQTVTQYANPAPAGWQISVQNNEGTVQANASAERRRNQAGQTVVDLNGHADYLVRVLTTASTASSFSLVCRYTGTAAGAADVLAPQGSARARGSTEIPALKTREVKATEHEYTDSVTLGPTTTNKSWNYSNVSWVTVPAGKQVDVYVGSGSMTALATAYSSGDSGSNMYAAISTGTGIEKMKPTALKMGGGGSAGFVSGSKDSFVANLSIEVRNEFNAPLDNWVVGGLPTTFDLPFDQFSDGTYRLYLWAPGSLRKRVVIDYVGSAGVSGIDGALVYGDINRDNTIRGVEVDAIFANIGRTNQQPGWSDTIALGCTVSDCDLNQDGAVTSADYAMAVGNVGAVGDY
jgi:hypothetical protein